MKISLDSYLKCMFYLFKELNAHLSLVKELSAFFDLFHKNEECVNFTDLRNQ